MTCYETVFIARPDLTETQVKDLTKKFTDILTKNGGKVLKTEYWGLRTLAYKINKSSKGHYALIESEADGKAIAELDRLLRLDEDVMRYMSVRLKAPSKEPSVILSNTGVKKPYIKREAA